MTTSSTIAYIANREGLDSQALLSAAVAQWRAAGIEAVGVLAENNETEGMCSAGFLRDLASGKRFSIQLDAPPAGTSCHLDTAGMEDAGAGLLTQIPQADIVVFSKFGKLEATQKGLWAAFAAAISAGRPLLTTVSPKHAQAWQAFAPAALRLESKPAAIAQWWNMIRPGPR
ncbi:DUF2478 domain-containing protein [Candidimonas humi]|uniref:DUF2478 domain-containing protein n=1 Tax=Candidimonas humi TaxID=683355 RepID=A0ABV8NWQ0_9BURK|nr:DUF2478 domain-containing protein [Candidimonas humi]MBV6305780.1 DUF2478 domain-containing protein [Candidimonas humi]